MKTYIPLQLTGKSHLLLLSSIVYIIQSERKVLVITDDGNYMIYGCVGDFESYLDRDFEFARKYLIINFRKVQAMENCTVRFFNGEAVYLGKTNFNKLRKKYNQYLAMYQK